MPQQLVSNRRNVKARMGPTQAADIEYFCRTCKGHYSRIVPVDSFWNTYCRCGSQDLLIYNIASEASAPLRR